MAGKKFLEASKKSLVQFFAPIFFPPPIFFLDAKKRSGKNRLRLKRLVGEKKQKYFDELFPAGSVGLLGPRASLD